MEQQQQQEQAAARLAAAAAAAGASSSYTSSSSRRTSKTVTAAAGGVAVHLACAGVANKQQERRPQDSKVNSSRLVRVATSSSKRSGEVLGGLWSA